MAKNDYRRSLIMLRGLEKGYSGHARLEKRVLSGTMDFVTAAPSSQETLTAAFIGTRGGKTHAQALGVLKNDGRGQRALLASFDPRNISGMDLSDISAAVISRVDENGASPVMYGYINGARPLDWRGVQSALNELFSAPSETASDKPSADNSQTYAEPEEEPETETEAEPAVIETAEPDTLSSAPPAITLLSGIDPSAPWPRDIEALRILFLTMPAYEPFQKDGFVFVKAGMAEETGIDHCAVGVRAQNGKISEVCYAIPLPYTPEPPAGLEGYGWIGNAQSGWWVTCDDVDDDDD